MGEHYGIWSVLPPLLAVALAMFTRRIVVSLLVGVFTAALVLSEGNPLRAIFRCITEDLFHSLIHVEHVQVFAFTLLMGGMVGVMHSSGAMRDLVLRLEHYASNRRRGQVFTWVAGLLIFFDDYANTLLLGTTFQPVADRLKISREKLAYIVDSTAAPVAGLAVISTWVAGEVQFIESGLVQTAFGERTGLAFFIFIETILYRFYPILALLLVGFVAYSGRDFGPMRRAERSALQAASHPVGGTPPENSLPPGPLTEAHAAGKSTIHLALFPITVMVVLLAGILWWTGLAETGGEASWWEVLGSGDAYGALVWASLAGCLTAMILSWNAGRGSVRAIALWAWRGFTLMSPALLVLWLAWTLADMTGSGGSESGLGTSIYLAGLLQDVLSPVWLPTLVFILASLVAYCTGTSWGTMSILIPLVIPLACKILGDGEGVLHAPIFSATVGGVLAGSIFGDHCSPLSDTTILSSRASGCDHMAHVWTQAPYAALAGGISILCGTIPIGLGIPIWIVLPGAILSLWLAHRLLSRDPSDP